MILTLKNISKQYKDKLALCDFNMEMNPGVYGLLGPNGAGKTTLMRILAGVLNPTTGTVYVNGDEKNSMGELYRDLLGYLPQELGLYKNFSAHRFLMYVASLKGLKKNEARNKTRELLELVGLSDGADRLCGNFSGGMKRRLGIAQALLNDPKILILDEPTSGLDPKERIRFRNLISSISKDRIVLLSTHIVSDLDMIAKTIILLKDGHLIKSDTGDNLLKAMDGKVWMVKAGEQEFARYEAKYAIANVTHRDGFLSLRVISDIRPSEDAVLENASFEDMYLYYFNETGERFEKGAVS